MFAEKRSPSLLGGRIDADFYAPLYVNIERKLSGCGVEVGRLGAKLQRVFKGAFYLLASEYQEAGVPFVRVTQITSGFVDLGEAVFLSPATHQREIKTAVRPGYLVFAKGGAYRHCAVIPSSLSEANISQDLIGAIPAQGLDPHYAHSFLSSKYGRPQLIRWQQGDAQPHLSNDSVKHVLLPLPHEDVQIYVGHKLRQAERLRERARAAEEAFRAAVASRYPAIFGPIQAQGRTNRATVADLDGYLNPGAFNPERVRIRRYLSENSGRRIRDLASIATPTADDNKPSDPYLGLDGVASSSCMLIVSTIGADEVNGTVRVLPEGPAIAKLRPYLNKVCYVPTELAGCFGSTEFLCLRPKTGVSGWFLYGVLNSTSKGARG